jgi:hypothetical protein
VGVPEGESRFPLQGPTIQQRNTDIDLIIRNLSTLRWWPG